LINHIIHLNRLLPPYSQNLPNFLISNRFSARPNTDPVLRNSLLPLSPPYLPGPGVLGCIGSIHGLLSLPILILCVYLLLISLEELLVLYKAGSLVQVIYLSFSLVNVARQSVWLFLKVGLLAQGTVVV